MAFVTIPISFEALNAGYPDNKSLPPLMSDWLDKQHVKEKEYLDTVNAVHIANNEKLEKGPWSTSCCMQVSVAFNRAGATIPGSSSRRANTMLDFGFCIMAVDEFYDYLTSKYGRTDAFVDFADIRGMKGVVIMEQKHIELFDGGCILQSPQGLARYGRNSNAMMSDGFINGARPYYFWQTNGDTPSLPASTQGDIPDWLVGWWRVYDGTNYYYYFFKDRTVVYIETVPNLSWVPPKAVHNRGVCVKNDNVHGYTVTWNLLPGETTNTVEDFTPLRWTSQTEMNGVSHQFGNLYATKLASPAGS